MPPNTGYTSSLPTDVILDQGIIYVGGTTPYGVARGVTVNLAQEYKQVQVDGMIYPKVGLDRRVGGEPTIEGTWIEINNTKALDMEASGSTATVTTVTTITPNGAGDLLVAADYKADVRAVFRRGGGGFVWVIFPFALYTVDSITGQPKGEGEIKFKFSARQDAASADLGVAPYQIVLAAAV